MGLSSTLNDGATAWRYPIGRFRAHCRIAKDRDPRHSGRNLLEQLQPFPRDTVLEQGEANVAARPRETWQTNPAPTGSMTLTNTTGRVRLNGCNATTAGLVAARMMSGASATNSAAYLRKRSASPAAQR